jgi:hypothetical protein
MFELADIFAISRVVDVLVTILIAILHAGRLWILRRLAYTTAKCFLKIYW